MKRLIASVILTTSLAACSSVSVAPQYPEMPPEAKELIRGWCVENGAWKPECEPFVEWLRDIEVLRRQLEAAS